MKVLKTNEFMEAVNNGTSVVDFYADWCGPCKMLGPVLEQLDCEVIKVDVDKHNELAIKNGVMSVPTVFIYENGTLVNKFIGFKTLEEIQEILKK